VRERGKWELIATERPSGIPAPPAETRCVMHEYREFTMKRIIVATDFSDASYGAVNYARQLAR